jgi:hypothetical protein
LKDVTGWLSLNLWLLIAVLILALTYHVKHYFPQNIEVETLPLKKSSGANSGTMWVTVRKYQLMFGMQGCVVDDKPKNQLLLRQKTSKKQAAVKIQLIVAGLQKI